ncbi:beta-glucosidase [Sinomicrobium pectinilyticum]|uniref:Beta-glucosidase n=1 Tax=Sinomicrobium pectinilyticum TaxID=1084421 RepID=A0A3N0F4Z3_SINP1|nr:glucoamylase family protein [Sinomicrobium pectinilyticum]RNL95131.1 beta-glucosidase [Sinomicrobium pectinilyticum]
MRILIFVLGIFCLIGCNNSRRSTKNTPEKDTSHQNEEEHRLEQLSEEELLDIVQKQTLKYFWDYAEPNSGMARERYHPDGDYPKNDAHIVTTGGSGFGLMAIVTGMERGFIPRNEGVERLRKIAGFLEATERYHGAWPHWINGETGETRSFSDKDNGGDIVETSFLAQGFIVVREYLKNGNEEEKAVARKYNELWEGIDWNWYTNGKDGIFWHWSPVYEFEKNFKIEGYNECLITYIMAASSPDHAIDPEVYHKGWARNGNITTDKKAYDLPLILKHNTSGDKGGPLFWAHYSYLGLNPKNLQDKYASYWDLNVNHSKINYKYCVENPKQSETYSPESWGLTASYSRNEDNSIGYTAHSPDNDKGVVSPTAAVSSIPYTPEESLRAIRYFYTDLNDLVWGPAGFYDAFSLDGEPWVADKYLAIDQGPVIVMIENYRSGLIWDLFMQNEDIQNGLKKLGFTSPYIP